MVILEVLSGEPPFARDKNFIVMRKVIEGERPQKPEGAWFTDSLWRTLEQCWLPQPKDRPAVEAVFECLGEVSKGWHPLPPIGGDVEMDDDESVSTTTHRMFFSFVPNPLLTTKKHTVEFASGLPRSNEQAGIDTSFDPLDLTKFGLNISTEGPTGPPKEWWKFLQRSGTSRTERGDDPESIMKMALPGQNRSVMGTPLPKRPEQGRPRGFAVSYGPDSLPNLLSANPPRVSVRTTNPINPTIKLKTGLK